MASKWFFYTADEVIILRSRVEADGVIGDAEAQIRKGDEDLIPGLTYEALAEAGSGVLEIADDNTFRIAPTAPGIVG